jgi:hypothetical protein
MSIYFPKMRRKIVGSIPCNCGGGGCDALLLSGNFPDRCIFLLGIYSGFNCGSGQILSTERSSILQYFDLYRVIIDNTVFHPLFVFNKKI